MQETFIENLLRYPRFFISSVSGLVVILINPLIKNFNKNLKTRLLGILIILTIAFGLNQVLQSMLNI